VDILDILSFGSPLHSSDLVGHYCLRQETEKPIVCPSTHSIPHINLDTSRIRSSHHLCIRQDTVPAQNMVCNRFRHLNFCECLSYCHAFLRASQELELGTMLSEHQGRSVKSSGPFPQFHLPSKCTCTTVLFSFLLP
jgi:hypothetical protein